MTDDPIRTALDEARAALDQTRERADQRTVGERVLVRCWVGHGEDTALIPATIDRIVCVTPTLPYPQRVLEIGWSTDNGTPHTVHVSPDWTGIIPADG